VKRVGVVVGVLLLSVGVAAFSLSICDYQSPETSLTDAGLSFTYRYYDDAATAGVDVNSGRLAADYEQLYASPSYGFTINGSAELALDSFMPTGWLGQGGATFRYYPFDESLAFAFGDVQASLATGQPRPGVEVRFGAGLGRFSDVTPMAKTLLIQRQLMNTGAIPGRLSDDVLMAIARIIGRAVEYDTTKELVADIDTLVASGAGVTLDARSTLTIEEIVLATGDKRQCGWALQVGVGYELVDPFGNPQNVVVAATADAAVASGPDDQMKFHASFSGPFDLMNENTLSAVASYEYSLSEDATVSASYSLQRVKPAGVVATMTHSAGLTLGLNVSGVDVLLQFAATRDPGDPGWSYDISISAAMELL
jgi:hypothetical protein